MCGFVGVVSRSLPETEVLPLAATMLVSIAHRGPDDRHTVQQDNCAFGFCRLSILDLSLAARQPMRSPDGKILLAFNGEIYNFIELREELEAKGHAFSSSGDTEVLLHAYLEWGMACVQRLNGMWAFLIYDSRDGMLYGSRDRFGMKPLYRYSGKNCLLFASEIKAIRASGHYVDQLNLRICSEYLLEDQLDHTGETFFAGIEQLPAGTCFSLDRNFSLREWRYWQLESLRERPVDQQDEAFAQLFEDAVGCHTRSDVPVAVHLSGGLDSTSIICAMARKNAAPSGSNGRIKAFSFISEEFDESTYIRDTVEQTGADLVPLKTSAQSIWVDLPQVLGHHDEPLHSLTAVVSYQLMRLTAEHGIKVVLNGQGADETLGGYPSYFRDYWYSLLRKGHVSEAWRQIGRARRTAYPFPELIHIVRHVIQSELRTLHVYRRVAHHRRLARATDAYSIAPALASYLRKEDQWQRPYLRSSLINSVTHNPLPLYLRVEDRNAMAHSIESRLPFLDHRLVALAFSLADSWKLRSGWNKYVLREAMRGRIPESVRSRRDKMGFPTPTARWIRNELNREFRAVVDDICAGHDGYLNGRALKKHFEDHCSGGGDRSAVLFRGVQLHLWLASLKEARPQITRTASAERPSASIGRRGR